MSADVARFRDVYLEHFDFVWSVLRRLGVREQDAQDVAQKVFLVVYGKLPGFEARASMRTWLYRICLHAASDYRRAAPRRREVATEPAEMEHLASTSHELRDVVESERLELAESILNKLPDLQREVFVMYELEHLSGPEIAELLGISLGTVRSRMRLAREAFVREAKRLAAREQVVRRRA